MGAIRRKWMYTLFRYVVPALLTCRLLRTLIYSTTSGPIHTTQSSLPYFSSTNFFRASQSSFLDTSVRKNSHFSSFAVAAPTSSTKSAMITYIKSTVPQQRSGGRDRSYLCTFGNELLLQSTRDSISNVSRHWFVNACIDLQQCLFRIHLLHR